VNIRTRKIASLRAIALATLATLFITCGNLGDLPVRNDLDIPVLLSSRVLAVPVDRTYYPEEEFADVFNRMVLPGEQTFVPFAPWFELDGKDETWLYIGVTTVEGVPVIAQGIPYNTLKRDAPILVINMNSITIEQIP